jgi:hypothetical protein
MEAKIFLLDENFNLIKEIDDYISLIWCERFIEFGAVDLEFPATKENIELYKEERYIFRKIDKNAYYQLTPIFKINNVEIETNEEKDDTLIVGGIDLRAITEQVTIPGKVNHTEMIDVYAWIKATVNNIFSTETEQSETDINRSDFPFFQMENFKISQGYWVPVKTDFLSDKEDEILSEHIFHILKNGNVGWSIKYDTDYGHKIFWFVLYQGADRSVTQNENAKILFSTDFENLQNTKKSTSIDDFKNVAIVKHNYKDKLNDSGFLIVTNENQDVKGFNRYSILVDGTEIELESTNADDVVTFKEKLRALGLSELNKHKKNKKFECGIIPNDLKYKTDFHLGDIVSVKTRYGELFDGRIIEVIETFDETGYSIEPVLEYIERPVIENALKTNNDEYLLTETGEYIIYT